MKLRTLALGAIVAIALTAPAAAQDGSAADKGGDWQVSFSPYAWAAGVDGSIDLPAGGQVDFDRSFTSNLKFAFMGALNVEHGKFVFLVDGNYLSLKSVSNDIEAPAHIDGELRTKLLETTPLVGYKVIDSGETSGELLAGARIISLENDVLLELPSGDVEVEDERSLIAPVVAARLRTPLGGRWSVTLYGDVGGLTDLDSTWQLLGLVNYRLGDRWSLAAGYRHLSLHSDKPRGDIDVRFSGPMFGATYRFN